MDLAGLRSLVREVNFTTHGVPAIVGGVQTRIIWLTPITEERPGGADFNRADPRRVLAIRRDDVPAVPRGTSVAVTEHTQEAPSVWTVDAMDQVFPDHYRVTVVPAVVP
jgi:hypothetical protein